MKHGHQLSCAVVLSILCLGVVGCHGTDLSGKAFACLDKVMKLGTSEKLKQENIHVEYYPTSKGEYLLMVSKTLSLQLLVRGDEVFGLNKDTVNCFKVKPLYDNAEIMKSVLTETSEIVAQTQEGRRAIIELQRK